jgi:pyridoxal phosphate enzyme (YggS family)
MSDLGDAIAHHIEVINKEIRAAEIEFNRPQNSVSLLAVSKSQSVEKIKAAIQGGHYRFGENYYQEAIAKIEALKNDYSLEWHFIGSIQTNKTRMIAAHFDWVHTVNTIKVADMLHRYRFSNQPPLNVCIQINISAENSKSGIMPDKLSELMALVRCIRALDRLRLRGLMAIPKPSHSFNEQQAIFQQVAHLQQQINQELQEIGEQDLLDTLSMGMSNDFVAAIAAGSTIVRIGARIFR